MTDDDVYPPGHPSRGVRDARAALRHPHDRPHDARDCQPTERVPFYRLRWLCEGLSWVMVGCFVTMLAGLFAWGAALLWRNVAEVMFGG